MQAVTGARGNTANRLSKESPFARNPQTALDMRAKFSDHDLALVVAKVVGLPFGKSGERAATV